MLTLDQFQRELSYRAALSAARRLQTEEIITRREFVRIDAVSAPEILSRMGRIVSR